MTNRVNFGLIGAAGYIAPRHLKAIRDTGNSLTAAVDPNDSVGVIDSYFPDTRFFTEFEHFDCYLDDLRRTRSERSVSYISICSPNYLHDSHIRFALRSGTNVVCEKPLVLEPEQIDRLLQLERDSNGKVNTILQLRIHPAILALRDRVRNLQTNAKHDVDLTYITSRGHWYFQSWKGDMQKSGGLATNIGVHFYDMLHFVFGKVQANLVHLKLENKAAGYLEYEKARVRWFLSVDVNDVPYDIRARGQRTFRSMSVDGEQIEFSDGFTDLHTRLYEELLAGRGFGLEENRVAVQTVSHIRSATALGLKGDYHPMLKAAECP